MAVKWFPDRRGMASGIITAGYGMGAAAFNPLFDHLIRTIGYSDTFLWTGISHGALIMLAGLVLVNPPADYKVAAAAVKPKVRRHDLDFTCSEMLRTPQFYFLFFAMLSIGIGGLMVTAQLKPVATDFKIGAGRVDCCTGPDAARQWLEPHPVGMGLGLSWPRVDHVHRVPAAGNLSACRHDAGTHRRRPCSWC